MADRQTVFLPEFISEDTNPWDSRTRYSLCTSFEGAESTLKTFTKYDKNGAWAKTDTYGGGNAKTCWKWCSEPNEDGTYEDDGDGYGLYIWEEYVD